MTAMCRGMLEEEASLGMERLQITENSRSDKDGSPERLEEMLMEKDTEW